ncbi:MAG: TVP38/TMEM64 family protein [Desulfuromonadales bacterium]
MKSKHLLLLLVAALFVGLFFALDLGRFLTLETLQDNRQRLLAVYREHPLLIVAAFMALYIVQSALSLPGAIIFALSAGAIFGPWWGTVTAVTAATVGATLCFLAVRTLWYRQVSERFGTRLEGLNRELEARGLGYLLFVRLVPVFPFFLINLAAGLTRLPLRTFMLGTLVGMLPGGFVYVNAGASLASVTRVSDIASPRVLASLALLGLLALVPTLYIRFKTRRRRNAA